MTGIKSIVRASLVAALAMLIGGGIASAQQSHSPFNSPASIRLQFDSPATATTTRTGTIQVTINITVKSAISTPILCEAQVAASDADYANSYLETTTATASRGTTTATCTVNVPMAVGNWRRLRGMVFCLYDIVEWRHRAFDRARDRSSGIVPG